MRRSVKVAALASAATLLAIGASMTSFAAARGWTQEDGEWVWLDSDGERVTEEFKLSGSKYYWLNEDGVLGSDELVEYKENYYYVDETGAMVTNQWKEVENEDDDEFEDTVWYYFQSSGKAYKSGKKSINGTSYIFNEDGKMLFGWIKASDTTPITYTMASKEDDTDEWKTAQFYAGEANDGAVVTSAWRQIRVNDDSPAQSAFDAGENDYWFYFGSNGRKYGYKDNPTEKEQEKGYQEKTVNGKKYAFSIVDGHMFSEWTMEEATTGATNSVKYYSSPENGARMTKGWFKVVPSYAIDDADYKDGNNDEHWFYAKNDGTLENGGIKTVNGKKYLFNDDGELLSGLRFVVYENGEYSTSESMDSEEELDDYTKLGELTNVAKTAVDNEKDKTGMYYFATPIDTDAAMKTGSCTVTVDGDSYAFKFETAGTTKGKGVNGLDGNNYYVNGRKLKANSDQKFEIYQCTVTSSNKVKALFGEALTADTVIDTAGKDVEAIDGATNYAVVSSSGTIVRSGTKKDADDIKITVKNSVVTGFKNSDDAEWTVNGLKVTVKTTTK